MKYFSEKTKQCYDTAEECEKAENAYLVKVEEENKKVEEDKKLKKELVSDIEKAETEINLAYEELDKTKEEAAKILEESNKKVEDMLDAVRKKIAEAENKKADAIRAFNEKFGAYKVYYSGKRAEQEFNNALKWLDWLFRW